MSILVPKSGIDAIDALLFDYNWMAGFASNLIQFSFRVPLPSAIVSEISSYEVMSADQQAGVRMALDYVSNLTGIRFIETTRSLGTTEGLSFLLGLGPGGWAGLATGGPIYIAQSEFTGVVELTPGSVSYDVLLHEIGHELGLKHPFEGHPLLPHNLLTASNTLMASASEGIGNFGSYDRYALEWIYGGDGVGGQFGAGGTYGPQLHDDLVQGSRSYPYVVDLEK